MTETLNSNLASADNTFDHIPNSVKIPWAIGAAGVAFMMNTVAFWALFYMVNVLGVNPAIAGIVVFLPKIFDAITDPIIGAWSDRIKSDKSRRRPFLLGGAILASLSFLMVFTTPIFASEWMIISYIFIGLILFALGYTVFNIPYLSMPAEMTNDYHERTSIHGYRVVAISVGSLIAGTGIPLLLEHFGKTSWNSYAIMGGLGALFVFLCMMVTWAGTSKAQFTKAQDERPKILPELSHVFSNKHFLRLLAVKFCQLFGVAATIASFSFFVVNVMQRSFSVLALYGLVVGIFGILSAPIFVKISKKFGKSGTYIISTLFYIAAAVSWLFVQPGESTTLILLRAVLLGIASTGNVIMAMSMLTDIINYDAKISGVRREGVFTSFYSFVEKFTFAFGPLVVGVALAIAGFDKSQSGAVAGSEGVRQALLLGMSYIPAGMGLLSIVLLMGYKLKKEDIEG